MSDKFWGKHTRDCDKTKVQLINELAALRQEITNLETSDAEHHHAVLALQEASEYVVAIVDTVIKPLVVMDVDLRVVKGG